MSRSPSAYDAYRDDHGEPILRTSAVLFLDVLGMAQMATQSDAEMRLRAFLPVLEEARGRADATDTTGLQALKAAVLLVADVRHSAIPPFAGT